MSTLASCPEWVLMAGTMNFGETGDALRDMMISSFEKSEGDVDAPDVDLESVDAYGGYVQTILRRAQ